MANFIDAILIPIETFLDNAIDSGNIYYYLIGLVGLVLYLIIF